MTHATLGRLLANLMTDMEGGNGFWHGMRHEVPVYVVSDEEHDRMRIMSPIGTLRHPDPDFLSLLLQANFDRALDAKYALRKKELWAVFMHPLSTLVPDDLGTFLERVSKFPRIINVGNIHIKAQDVQSGTATITADCTATTFVLLDAQPAAAAPAPGAAVTE